MKKILLLLFLFTIGFANFSQARQKNKSKNKSKSTIPLPTESNDRKEGYKKRQKLLENSLVKNIPFKSVGPTVMSGRVVDLEVDPNDPSHFYVAFASGGLWETKNEGASYTSLFDNQIVMTIGDIAIDWINNQIFIGTGESNSSRSSYAGFGVYKSSDNGKTWSHLGLSDTHHIGRVIVHPTNKDIIWVAALGHLYSQNQERGIFKTTDGGKTWKKTLYVDDKTGFVELVIDPGNPDKLLAASWQKDRKSWNFEGAGPGSGIYLSMDGGETWEKSMKGFPQTSGVGRIGMAISPSNTNIIYAIHDNQDRKVKEEKKSDETLTKDEIKSMTKTEFLALSLDQINDFLDANNFPSEYNAIDISHQVKSDKISHLSLAEYLEDANSLLFDTPVKGAEVYKSTDGGKSWKKTHDKNIESLVFSYGYYFGQIRIDANNPDIIYTFGVPVISSADGGKTWESIGGSNVHADHHALWVNPNKSGHLILGNDGGVNISYDNGESWIHSNNLAVGQFYSVNYDMAKPYNVYGGLQDNGVWKGPSTYEFSTGWYSNGNYPYKRIMGGDGMQVAIDTRDNQTVYTGYQFGNYFRIHVANGDRKYITPVHELGQRPYRWNWQTPVQLSKHNQDILYMGSNKFHRSFDQGDNFETSSQDLTNGGKKGNVSFGTLTSIDESPIKFGLIYTGSDDGVVNVTNDGGYSFKNISQNLPANYWVTRVIASAHEENRVYVTLNGYRWDNFEALVYVSEDRGSTWRKIGLTLPKEPVNVIKEDPLKSNILYVGTDHGVYVSLDRGDSFMQMGKDLPAVAIHDLVIHPRDFDLIIGTHGRSIYIADIAPLHLLSNEVLEKEIHIIPIKSVTYQKNWGNKFSPWRPANEAKREITFYVKNASKYQMKIKNSEGKVIAKYQLKADAGINYFEYNYETDTPEAFTNLAAADNGKYYLTVGKYTIEISGNGDLDTKDLLVVKPKERPKRKGSE